MFHKHLLLCEKLSPFSQEKKNHSQILRINKKNHIQQPLQQIGWLLYVNGCGQQIPKTNYHFHFPCAIYVRLY